MRYFICARNGNVSICNNWEEQTSLHQNTPLLQNLTTLRQKDKNHSPDTPHQRKWDQTEKTIFFYWWLVKNNFRSLNLG